MILVIVLKIIGILFLLVLLRLKKLIDLIHCDVWGPYKISSLSGSHYFLSIVDDFSITTCVYLMKNKTEVAHLLTHFVDMVHNVTPQNLGVRCSIINPRKTCAYHVIRYHTFVSHLPGPIILQTEQSPCGYRVIRYHIVRLIHQDPSFYKTEQSPFRARSSSENHHVQCTVQQEKQHLGAVTGLPRRTIPFPKRTTSLRRGRTSLARMPSGSPRRTTPPWRSSSSSRRGRA